MTQNIKTMQDLLLVPEIGERNRPVTIGCKRKFIGYLNELGIKIVSNGDFSDKYQYLSPISKEIETQWIIIRAEKTRISISEDVSRAKKRVYFSYNKSHKSTDVASKIQEILDIIVAYKESELKSTNKRDINIDFCATYLKGWTKDKIVFDAPKTFMEVQVDTNSINFRYPRGYFSKITDICTDRIYEGKVVGVDRHHYDHVTISYSTITNKYSIANATPGIVNYAGTNSVDGIITSLEGSIKFLKEIKEYFDQLIFGLDGINEKYLHYKQSLDLK